MDKKSIFTKIFLDGGDPEETKEADLILKKAGFRGIEGQTTNPSLIAKRLESKMVDEKQALAEYKKIVQEMRQAIKGPISIQVFANGQTSIEEMLSQARERVGWIDNAVIKFPCTLEGLQAAKVFCREGSVNITLVLSQSQAAAAFSATKHRGVSPSGIPYKVFVSPFVGRLDDKGQNGMDLIANILQMYGHDDNHAQVLTASVRSVDHVLFALQLKSHIVTIPFKVLENWRNLGFPLPDDKFVYNRPDLEPMLYSEFGLSKNLVDYNLRHELTDKGVEKFWSDWANLIANFRK